MPDADAWSATYEAGITPWDLGAAHPELAERLDADPGLGTRSPGRVFVPGAGTGHDAAELARAGWFVTAADLAPPVEAALTQRLVPFDAEVLIGDALAFDTPEPYDLVFDHTFFCAIDPHRRAEFGDLCRRILRPSGSVISIVFPLDKPVELGGPPWGIDPESVTDALGDGFTVEEMAEPSTIPRRRLPHRWVRWVFDG